MSEGYARVSGHASASSPETLPLKRNAGIDDCQAGAISGCRSASGSLGGQTRLSARMSLIQFGIDERLLPRYAEANASNSVGKRSLRAAILSGSLLEKMAPSHGSSLMKNRSRTKRDEGHLACVSSSGWARKASVRNRFRLDILERERRYI